MTFGEVLQFKVVVPQLQSFCMDLHPPTHVQLKLPTIDVLDMLHLSVMQIVQNNWESFAHRDQPKKKTYVGYVAPKPQVDQKLVESILPLCELIQN